MTCIAVSTIRESPKEVVKEDVERQKLVASPLSDIAEAPVNAGVITQVQ